MESRKIQRKERFDKVFKSDKLEACTDEEKSILSYLYSKDKITRKDVQGLISRGRTYSLDVLKKMEEKQLIKWVGSSKQDTTQHYIINL